jgi:hypothetical protein
MAASESNSYHSQLDAFKSIVRYADELLRSVQGEPAPTESMIWTEEIFTSLVVGCKSLCKLLPESSSPDEGEPWDLMSIAAVSRCIVDAHDVFLYACDSKNPDCLNRFHLDFLKLHAEKRRLRLGKLMRSPDTTHIKSRINDLMESIKASKAFQRIPEKQRKNIENPDGVHEPIHLDRVERFKDYGLDKDFYDTGYTILSQFVHSHPLAIKHSLGLQAGSDKAYSHLEFILFFTTPFICRVVWQFREVVACPTPSPSINLDKLIRDQEIIYRMGWSYDRNKGAMGTRNRPRGFGASR